MRRVFDGLRGNTAKGGDRVLVQQLVKGRATDSELLGRLADLAFRSGQGIEDEFSLQLVASLLETPGRLPGPRGGLNPRSARSMNLSFRRCTGGASGAPYASPELA
jgi:hypothetical protein